MSSAEKALIEHSENEQGVELDQKMDITLKKDTKYSWFVCSCTFLTQVFILGVLHAYGVFFVEFIKEFKAPKGEAAWIGSLAYGLSMTFGPVTSVLVSRLGYSRIMVIGGAICAVSLLASSFATSILMLFMTFSVFYGIGTCMCTSPTMTITSEYFDKYLSVATGITVSGSSFGTLIMGPMSQAIIDLAGWRTAFRVFAGFSVLTMILNSRIRPQIKPAGMTKQRHNLLSDLQIWKNRVFVVWTLSIAMVMFGFYIPYVHLVSYAIDQGISPDRASMLMLILGATTAFGRIMFGKIIQIGVLNRLHMHQLSMVVTGTGVMLLPLIKSYIGIIMYVVTVGLVDGCFVVLLPIMTTSLVGIENSVLAWGFMIGTSSITFTLGPPVAGALYDMTGSYDIAFHCAGVPIVGGAILLFLIPWAQRTSSNTNILRMANEYTINETATSEMGTGAPYRSESTGTVCADERLVRNTTITKSNVTVQTTGTSPRSPMSFADKSTSTCNVPLHQFPLDIADALSQLSYNDKMFDDMLRHSFDGSHNSGASSQKDDAQIIPQIPPPSDPVRYRRNDDARAEGKGSTHSNYSVSGGKGSICSNYNMYSGCKGSIQSNYSVISDDKGGLNSNILPSGSISSREPPNEHFFIQSSVVPSSIHSEPNSYHPSTAPSHSVHSDIGHVCLPSTSQLFQMSAADPFQSTPLPNSLQASPRPQSVSASHSTADGSNISKEPSNFDQTISDQVSLLRDKLKSPTSFDSKTDNSDNRNIPVITSSTNSPRCPTLPGQMTTQPFINMQEPNPIHSILSSSENHISVQNSIPINNPTPGNSTDTAFPCSEDVSTIQCLDSTGAETTFDHDNQLTVIPGNNPFKTANTHKGKSSSTSPGKHLEYLFKTNIEEENVEKSSSSYEVIVTASKDQVAQTKSQTGELDMFTHLFDDDETQ